MEEKSSSSSSGGIGLCSVLFVLFLTLKLLEITAVANWSWWWVAAPLWIPTALWGSFMLVLGVVWLSLHLIEKKSVGK